MARNAYLDDRIGANIKHCGSTYVLTYSHERQQYLAINVDHPDRYFIHINGSYSWDLTNQDKWEFEEVDFWQGDI